MTVKVVGENADAAVTIVGGQVIEATPADVGKVVVVGADGTLGLAADSGPVLTVDGQTGNVDLSGSYAPLTTVTVVDVTGTSDTIAAGDLGKILRYTAAGLVTVTLPVGLAVGSVVNLLAWGAAGLAIQDDGTSVVQPEGAVAQFKEVSCVVVAADTWSVQGPVT